jgi:hypothetical protein
MAVARTDHIVRRGADEDAATHEGQIGNMMQDGGDCRSSAGVKQPVL